MTTNMGPQSEGAGPEMIYFAERASIVKAVVDVSLLSHALVAEVLIYRWVFGSQDLNDPPGAVSAILAGLKGFRDERLYVETYVGISKEQTAAYIPFLKVAVPLLHAAGVKVIGPSWYSGDFDLQHIELLRAAGWCGLDAFGIQGYYAPETGPTPWNLWRWLGVPRPDGTFETWYDATKDPQVVVLVETGEDIVNDGPGGTAVGKAGWLLNGTPPATYVDRLVDIARHLPPKAYACVYIGDATVDWRFYSINSIARVLCDALVAASPPPQKSDAGERSMIPGIDVASYQGAVDWSLVARAGRQYGFTKATEGIRYTNPTFAANWAGMKAAGLVRGAYCFGRPSRASGGDDARYFLSVVQDIQVGDLLALDLEDTDVAPTADLYAYALEWLATVKSAVGFRPLFYSGRWYTQPHNLEGKADLGQNGLWMADYDTSKAPTLIPGWDFWALWQYSSTNRVPGIAGNVDESLFNGDLPGLKRYGKIA